MARTPEDRRQNKGDGREADESGANSCKVRGPGLEYLKTTL